MPRQKSTSSQSHSERATARKRVAAQTSATAITSVRWRLVSGSGGRVRSIAKRREGSHKKEGGLPARPVSRVVYDGVGGLEARPPFSARTRRRTCDRSRPA